MFNGNTALCTYWFTSCMLCAKNKLMGKSVLNFIKSQSSASVCGCVCHPVHFNIEIRVCSHPCCNSIPIQNMSAMCCAKAAVSCLHASLCFWSWPGSATEMLAQWLMRAECPELGAGMCSECSLLFSLPLCGLGVLLACWKPWTCPFLESPSNRC